MRFRFYFVLLGLIGLLGGCSIPLGPQPSAEVAFRLVLPAPPSGAPGPRLLAAESVAIRLTIHTPSQPDKVIYQVPVPGTVEGVPVLYVSVKTTLGPHLIEVESLDENEVVLTSGAADVVLVPGANTLKLTLTPPNTLIDGASKALAAGQVAYFTIPASVGGYLRLVGASSTFWECAPDGSFGGTGDFGKFTVDMTGGTDKFVRVQQGSAASLTATRYDSPIVEPAALDLAVGTSDTTSLTETWMKLTWESGGQPVQLFRADALGGPYALIYSGTDEVFIDDETTGLVPGKTYYYTIADNGGILPDLTQSVLVSGANSAVTFPHLDPVPGVVSGTTMAWDAALNQAMPVVGMPYLVPDTSLIPALGVTWKDPELPTTALLAGGYTYWVWGTNVEGQNKTLIASFDWAGNFMSAYNFANNTITSIEKAGSNLVVKGAGNPGGTVIAWNLIAWHQPAIATATVNFLVPEAPEITFTTNTGTVESIVLDKSGSKPSGLEVTPELGGLSLIQWTLDGNLSYPGGTPFNIDGDTLYIDPKLLSLGAHEVMVLVTDGVSVYSANFSFTVIELVEPEPQS